MGHVESPFSSPKIGLLNTSIEVLTMFRSVAVLYSKLQWRRLAWEITHVMEGEEWVMWPKNEHTDLFRVVSDKSNYTLVVHIRCTF